jgi:hypothetical protein
MRNADRGQRGEAGGAVARDLRLGFKKGLAVRLPLLKSFGQRTTAQACARLECAISLLTEFNVGNWRAPVAFLGRGQLSEIFRRAPPLG